MPDTAFNTLSIISGRSIWESYGDIENTENEYEQLNKAIEKINSKISIKQDQVAFLEITTLSNNMVEYYSLKPNNCAVATPIPKNEYSAYVPGWPNITIVCKSLETLKLNLGALHLNLNPGFGRPMEDIDHWKQTMKAALLKELYNL